jgi:hypothetical protein
VVPRRRWRYALAFAAAAALIAGEDWLRRGNPLDGGYAGNAGFRTAMPYSGLPGFSYPFLFGLLSILFSFGKGLVFFTPALFLPARRRLLALAAAGAELFETYRLWVAFVVGLVLAYASWWAWYGGWFWGPRFFLFASLPASLVLAVRLRDREAPLPANLLTLATLALSAWVGIDGAAFGQAGMDVCLYNNFALEALCHYTPDFSALWHPFVVAGKLGLGGAFLRAEGLGPAQVLYIGYAVVVAGYLALPLLRITAAQLAAEIRALDVARLRPAQWRF